jgi:hypothetical protein
VTAAARPTSTREPSRARIIPPRAGEIVEIVAHVALNVFTNYVNKVADTEIDFPVVRTADANAA